jgi:hypothetical protein
VLLGLRRCGVTACHDCNRPYGDAYGFPDLLIPDAQWRKISPNGDGSGLLCPSCICKRLHDAGVTDCPGAFVSGPIRTVTAKSIVRILRAESGSEKLPAWSVGRARPTRAIALIRRHSAMELLLFGWKLREIGEYLGISRQGAQQLAVRGGATLLGRRRRERPCARIDCPRLAKLRTEFCSQCEGLAAKRGVDPRALPPIRRAAGARECADCGEPKKIWAKGLCERCYHKRRYRDDPGRSRRATEKWRLKVKDDPRTIGSLKGERHCLLGAMARQEEGRDRGAPMIPRARFEPGKLFAVPILAPATPGPARAEVAILRVTATTFRDVFYVETRHGRERSLRCSPEVFQQILGKEGAEIVAGQVP